MLVPLTGRSFPKLAARWILALMTILSLGNFSRMVIEIAGNRIMALIRISYYFAKVFGPKTYPRQSLVVLELANEQL